MPLKDDLLQRTVEGLARALAHVTGRVLGPAALAEVEAQLDRAYRELVGVERATLRRLPSAEIVRVLNATGTLDAERAYAIAALLELDAAVPGLEAPRQAALRVAALDLYAEAGAARVGQADLRARVRRLRSDLMAYQLPDATYDRLLRYLEADARLAEAEDLLFEWLEDGGATRTIVTAGQAFYARLWALDDAALERGDLPRAEVLEGRVAFEASCAG